jgi:hypothetical protein
MQQRAIVSSQSVEQVEDNTTVKNLSQPIELTEAQLLQVMGGLGPNGGWTAAVVTAGPNGGW